VRLSALGDVLHALPVLSGLKALVPTARVTWVVEDRHAGLLEGHPDLERVVVLPRAALRSALRGVPRPLRLAREAGRFVRTLREGGYDLALDLQGNLKSGLVARASGARRVIGFDRHASREANHLFLHHGVRLPRGARHKVERNLALLAGALGLPVPYVAPRLALHEHDHRAAREALAAAGLPAGGITVLHPGTSAFGAFKRWPAARFGALARRVADRARPAAVTYGPEERALAEDVAAASDGCAVPVPTGSLRTLAALLSGARVVVAGDTGPLHVAALLGTPVLGVYGPKDPAVYGPYGVRRDGSVGPLPVVMQADVACRPCTLRRCDAPLCLTTLEPDAVAGVLRSIGSSDR
jgi:lipopolysaccharide heptosyltransferase I